MVWLRGMYHLNWSPDLQGALCPHHAVQLLGYVGAFHSLQGVRYSPAALPGQR